MKSVDPYGTPHPAYKEGAAPRFKIYVRGYEPDDAADGGIWTHKLVFIDRKYQDSDGYPIDAIAAGKSWEAAFKVAAEWVDKALSTDHCIF